MNLQEQTNRIKQMMGLVVEQDIIDQSFSKEMPDELKSYYKKINYKEGVLRGFSISKNAYEVIEPSNPWYKPLIEILKKLSTTPESSVPTGPEGPVVDGFDRMGNPIKVDLGKLTADDIKKVYRYSFEYQKAFNKFRKKHPSDMFCVGDVYDISDTNKNVEEVRKCGAPSFENIVPNKLRQKGPFLNSILFLVFRPNDPKTRILKKNLGIK